MPYLSNALKYTRKKPYKSKKVMNVL